MNTQTSAARADIRPLEFTLAVVGGGVGSAVLSAGQQNPWVSVGFALSVMAVVSFLRWRIANECKDSQSLESFSEDIYLLGYLLTLAALLGLAPRLMKDDTNLFHIAGVKLCTTIAGLGIMMIFRQLARRWAADSGSTEVEKFNRQEELFRAAVSRLNGSASDLTAKMEELAHRFDPDLLSPVAEWGNRAANAFSAATRAFESVPTATEQGIRRINELGSTLEHVQIAATNLSSSLSANLEAASKNLVREFGQAGDAARSLSAIVSALEPATEASRGALEHLGKQAIAEVKHLEEFNQGLARTTSELGNVAQTLNGFAGEAAKDVTAPINQLVKALATAAEKTTASTERVEQLCGDLKGATIASNNLGNRLEREVAKPLSAHETALAKLHQQLESTARLIESLSKQIELVAQSNANSSGSESALATELTQLRKVVGENTQQLQMLAGRIDSSATGDNKSGLWNRIFGGGPGPENS